MSAVGLQKLGLLLMEMCLKGVGLKGVDLKLKAELKGVVLWMYDQ